MSDSAVAEYWNSGFDEDGLQTWAASLRGRLQAEQVTLGLVFMTPPFFPHAGQVLEILRVHGQIPILAGCSSNSLIVSDRELEDQGGLVLGLYNLPGAQVKGFHFNQAQVEEANGPAYWHLESGVGPEQTHGWLAFVDPFHLDGEAWLRSWNQAYPSAPTLGGLASNAPGASPTQVYLNGEVWEEGGVALSFGGSVGLTSLVSQGCTPIGEAWPVTKVDGNIIHEIGNRPAYQVLEETFKRLPQEQKKRAQGNLCVGLVVNEYQEDFQRGDFLIRNLLGGDPKSGAIAVGARPRPGQSLQFQCRDAVAASEDLAALLQKAREVGRQHKVYGGCLCSCNGRGKGLFGVENHDAALTQQHLGPLALTGFFCNGEIGPVGQQSFLHGYSATLALFVRKDD